MLEYQPEGPCHCTDIAVALTLAYALILLTLFAWDEGKDLRLTNYELSTCHHRQ